MTHDREEGLVSPPEGTDGITDDARPAAGGPAGARVPRREDARFMAGRGLYTDDVSVPGCLYAAFVRSPHAHALIGPVKVEPALRRPGVVAAYTGADLAAGGANPIPTSWQLDGMHPGERRALALKRVRHVGECLALVIAETPESARAAVEYVDADYEPLPAVADVEAAVGEGAPTVYDDAPGNVCFEWSLGDAERTAAAMETATRVVSRRLRNNRVIANALEPRACAAFWDPASEKMTLWVTSQNPHVHRQVIGGHVLGIPEHRFRVISPDVGGGFGSKMFVYQEEVAVAWASRALGRPVRWTAERGESLVSDSHGRDHSTEAEIAFDGAGRITALRVRTLANVGANLSLSGAAVPTALYGPQLSGQYRIPAIHLEVTGVFTHTVPCDAYRGGGRPEATYVIERMVEEGARALGVDPVHLRRSNLVPVSEFPYRTAVGAEYEVCNYEGALDLALSRAEYGRMREEQDRLRLEGRHLGIGLSSYVGSSGGGPAMIEPGSGIPTGFWEAALVRVHPTGTVTVFTGCHSQGQGHETTFAQIAADVLGIGVEDIEVEHGESAVVPSGAGTPGSRGIGVGGSAVHMAARRVRSKAAAIAARMLEVDESELEAVEGGYRVRGRPQMRRSWQETSFAAYSASGVLEGMEPGLEGRAFFEPADRAIPYGTHIALVEIDADTGSVTLKRYVAVDDAGNVINPMIVDGMLHGGIAQGVGQALFEEVLHDAAASPVTRSFDTYAMPRADALPAFETDRIVTPTSTNPLGARGIGEAGTIAAPAAVANAVMDALAPLGVEHLDMPFTAERVWRAMRDAADRRAGVRS